MLRNNIAKLLRHGTSFRLLASIQPRSPQQRLGFNHLVRSFGSRVNPLLNTTPQQVESSTNTAFQDLLGVSKPNVKEDLTNTFYQRELPTTLVRFASPEGKLLFKEAMDSGHAEGFFPLTGNFTTQSEPAYCGPSSCKYISISILRNTYID